MNIEGVPRKWQQKIYATRQINELMAEIQELATKKLDNALDSGKIPEYWLEDEQQYELAKAILDSICRDRPFAPLSEENKEYFNRIHNHT